MTFKIEADFIAEKNNALVATPLEEDYSAALAPR